MYDHNSLCNRLLQANFNDYHGVLAKYMRFLDETEIIHDYILDCGPCDQNMEKEFKEVQTHEAIFTLGDTDSEEVRNVYAILGYIVQNNINVYYGIGMSYSSSRKFQEILKDFNDRVTMVLMRHIENYLTDIGIDMGIDDKVIYNITVKDGQVNIATDSAVITATNNVSGIKAEELGNIISHVLEEAKKSGLTSEELDNIQNSLDVIAEETKEKQPRKSFLRTALTAIKAIKGTAEFGAAVASLVQFIQPLL